MILSILKLDFHFLMMENYFFLVISGTNSRLVTIIGIVESYKGLDWILIGWELEGATMINQNQGLGPKQIGY